MSATISDFCARVSSAIRRGTKYDEVISGYAADAVRALEDKENWKYMWQEDSGSLTIGQGYEDFTRVKSIRHLVLVTDAGDRIPVKKTKFENVTSITAGRPGAYWMRTKDRVAFDALPDLAYNYEVGYYQFSAVPLEDDLAWLTIAEELLISKTILGMQPILRDDKLIGRWGPIYVDRMATLMESDLVSETDGEDNVVVPFTSEMEELSAGDIEFE